MRQPRLQRPSPNKFCQILKRQGLGQSERSRTRPPQTRQMCATTQQLAKIMSDRANIPSRRNPNRKLRQVAPTVLNRELVDRNLRRLQRNRLPRPSKLMRRHARNLFRRKDRRSLLHIAGENPPQLFSARQTTTQPEQPRLSPRPRHHRYRSRNQTRSSRYTTSPSNQKTAQAAYISPKATVKRPSQWDPACPDAQSKTRP